ncbi:MAG: KAP family NTPase [Methanobrevibacter sp.]|jgi:hypothetical protein|nr:KAP family NTPase [Candidatus Methanoflexus mossambicus]
MNRHIVSDDEIDFYAEEDFFNLTKYSENLLDLIYNNDSHKTIVIGLFGEWGRGKSSIIKSIESKIKVKNEEENEKVVLVKYDAWKYENDSFRRMFLMEIVKKLGFDEKSFNDKFYKNTSKDVNIKLGINNKWTILAIIGVIIAVIFLFFLNLDIFTIINENLGSIGLITLISLIISILSFLLALFKVFIVNFKTTTSNPYFFAPEQFEECFDSLISKIFEPNESNGIKNKIKRLSKRFFKKNSKKPLYKENIKKLIFAIDNIDRCSPDVAYKLLSDIKTFLKDNNEQIIFIIPLDDEILRKHLLNSNKFNLNSDRDNDENNVYADEFFRKLFDIIMRIKPIQNNEIGDYVYKINKDFNFQTSTLSIISEEYVKNPRRIIHVFNNLSTELCNYEEEFRKTNEAAICKYMILKEEYPEEYNMLFTEFYNDINGGFPESDNIFFNRTAFVERDMDKNVFNIIFGNLENYKSIPKNIYFDIKHGNTEGIEIFLMTDKKNQDEIIHYFDIELKDKLHRFPEIFFRILDVLMEIHEKIEKDKFKPIEKHFLDIQNDELIDLKFFTEKTSNMENIIHFAKYIDELYLIEFLHGRLFKNGIEQEKYAKDTLKSIILIFKDDCNVLKSFKPIFRKFSKYEYKKWEEFINKTISPDKLKCILD